MPLDRFAIKEVSWTIMVVGSVIEREGELLETHDMFRENSWLGWDWRKEIVGSGWLSLGTKLFERVEKRD